MENVNGDTLAELNEAEENVLRAHVVVVKAIRFLAGKGQNLLGTWGEIIHGRYLNSTRLEVQFTHGGLGHAF